MPRYDFQCGTCDRVFEDMIPLAEYPRCAPCPTCQSPDAVTRVHLPNGRVHQLPDSVVVYRAPDGSFRFPGDTGGASTAKYDAMGYERIEAKGWAEVRKLEHRLNDREQSQLSRANERRAEVQERADSQRRSEIRRGLEQGFVIPESRLDRRTGQVVHTGKRITVHLRDRAKDTMREAMEQNQAKGHREIRDPGIHVDAYSNDRSNRDESRDPRGKRRRD